MELPEQLDDVSIRERQLEAHLLHSPEYLQRWNRAVTRQITLLYLAVVLLIVVQGFITIQASWQIPVSAVIITTVTSLLSIINCLLLIRTKKFLRRLNDAWLKPDERNLVHELRLQRDRILTHPLSANAIDRARLN